MAGGGTGIRKYVGALKDTTTVSIAKVNSDYKELEIAIVKATNHVENPAKEKYIRDIFYHLSPGRARADAAYCIRALGRRLSKTRNWAVALKTLIVIHRALREVDPTFREELISYGRSSSHMLNLSYFKDDSSAEAWDYSAWVRNYALYLEERLESFRVLKYDVEKDPLKTKDLDTIGLLAQLPALQQLLFRLLGCQPQGSSSYNIIIQHALSMVALESVRIHTAINDGMLNLVDKFFDMQRDDATRALDIYKRAINQAEQLSEFYGVCKTIYIGRGERFLKIEQPPASFLVTMEEYMSNAPVASTVPRDQAVLAIKYKRKSEVEEPSMSPPHPPAPAPAPELEPVKEVLPVSEPTDLLGMKESTPDTSEMDHKNSLALAVVQQDNALKAPVPASAENVATSWELALVTAPSSNGNAVTSNKLAGGLDLLTLDSLYDEAHRRAQQNASYNPWETIPASGPVMQQPMHDPFYASNYIAAGLNVQMAAMTQQQQAFMLQQQQMMMMAGPQVHHQASSNPFADPYMHAGVHPYGAGMQLHAGNAYTGTGMM
ncbi:putative clathrin assembly protein At5g35200 [Phragmites australis]|uniref:putative clathrin assembly protein At5g35200 n=1 Tax=Phragmites australis TaxID=29695 RepID=UPI002D775D5B|nr:putative clathrin assembly protein At5g35200 [Phragmites australis]XP_062220618.1 putative clathrin assembly protein At5g35200 [Phragmites australis]XP_062220619.1 putative clathrin assembly protein At5g35200 [Phragmites australis]XP_062220620.1 putative clathrin assembly protein At5g35200 [Phragmites australis]XP_062220621.1 putative clathrin assembly protein At5g35200 [Phragmites australis]